MTSSFSLPPTYNFKQIENEIRGYWERVNIRKIVQEALSNKPPVGYVEGPPTMNGEPHIGHIRGRVIKDIWYRFSTQRGLNVIFRAGWDTQGLPVELQVDNELGLKGSKVENLKVIGVEKLVEACKNLVMKYNKRWVECDKLLGMSFDYEKAYWTYKDEYIEREWKYLEKAWERGLLGEGYRVVAYCPSCQTSLSHAEVSQGYEIVEDPSLYFKMKMKDEDAYIVLWTTMPFTVVTDELVGVNPNAKYAYVLVNNELWIIALERVEFVMKELGINEYKVIKVVIGSELEGKKYLHPLIPYIPGLAKLTERNDVHIIVAEEFVDVTTGTGLVHISPANGEEDFQVASVRKIPIFCPIDDRVYFTKDAGIFEGMFVRDADEKVVELLKKEGALLKIDKIKHEYPTCWRSHHKLVWLARREYFYWVDKLGDLALKAAEKVEYFYEPPKKRFIEIIREKVPWCISRERIWGTPLPIWVCTNCGEKIPAFSRKEILEKAIDLPDGPNFELHRPWIDRVLLKCPKCGGKAKREPFVLDTWHNSGAAPYSSFTDEEYEKLVPVEFLTEGIDQTRGWAYTLLINNVIMKGEAEAPFKAFLFQGHVLDEKGDKMSKSLGNIIDGYEILSTQSVDTLRFYLIWKASPIDSLSFSVREMNARPYQVLNTLYHMHIYFQQNSSYDGYDYTKHTLQWALNEGLLKDQERWLLSKLQSLIFNVTEGFNRCKFHEAARALEEFIIETLSQTYVPLTRSEIWDDDPKTLNRRLAIYATLAYVLKTLDILIHPIAPYTSEYLYTHCFNEKILLLTKWPEVELKFIDKKLELEFKMLEELISLANAARMKVKLKRRWPLKRAIFLIDKDKVENMIRFLN
ncbi:MAG: isoleucine--tRNA ligase, partial [Nitrososphaerales archaeon]